MTIDVDLDHPGVSGMDAAFEKNLKDLTWPHDEESKADEDGSATARHRKQKARRLFLIVSVGTAVGLVLLGVIAYAIRPQKQNNLSSYGITPVAQQSQGQPSLPPLPGQGRTLPLPEPLNAGPAALEPPPPMPPPGRMEPTFVTSPPIGGPGPAAPVRDLMRMPEAEPMPPPPPPPAELAGINSRLLEIERSMRRMENLLAGMSVSNAEGTSQRDIAALKAALTSDMKAELRKATDDIKKTTAAPPSAAAKAPKPATVAAAPQELPVSAKYVIRGVDLGRNTVLISEGLGGTPRPAKVGEKIAGIGTLKSITQSPSGQYVANGTEARITSPQ